MNETRAIIIDGVLGWKSSDDKQHVIIGLKQACRGEFPAALTHEVLVNTILSMIEALGAFAAPRMQAAEKVGIKPSWFEVWPSEHTTLVFRSALQTAVSCHF